MRCLCISRFTYGYKEDRSRKVEYLINMFRIGLSQNSNHFYIKHFFHLKWPIYISNITFQRFFELQRHQIRIVTCVVYLWIDKNFFTRNSGVFKNLKIIFSKKWIFWTKIWNGMFWIENFCNSGIFEFWILLKIFQIFRNIYREIFLNFHDILTALKYVTSIVPLIVHLLDYLMSCDARSLFDAYTLNAKFVSHMHTLIKTDWTASYWINVMAICNHNDRLFKGHQFEDLEDFRIL